VELKKGSLNEGIVLPEDAIGDLENCGNWRVILRTRLLNTGGIEDPEPQKVQISGLILSFSHRKGIWFRRSETLIR